MKFSFPFFSLFSCLTAYSIYSRKLLPGVSLKCYDKNLSGIILNFSYLDMRDEKGQSGSAHVRKGEREKEEGRQWNYNIYMTSHQRAAQAFDQKTKVQVRHVALEHEERERGNELPPVETPHHHGFHPCDM